MIRANDSEVLREVEEIEMAEIHDGLGGHDGSERRPGLWAERAAGKKLFECHKERGALVEATGNNCSLDNDKGREGAVGVEALGEW